MKSDKHEGKKSHKEIRREVPLDIPEQEKDRHKRVRKKQRKENGTEGSTKNHAGRYRPWRWQQHQHPEGDGKVCYGKAAYSERYDAYYCSVCKLWLEVKCDPTKNCEICKGRVSLGRKH